ncbi:glyoxalase superfamily protein [Mesorhizobium sp.]|uniref:glyoxalase superfamily protein n=1 Tax=Mesorhizobium sp. TaxID=1871066 RepID=UPI000FE3696C|nr:glyoxalase superfamily protein [Mesorhizobium sp.]RWA71666.1 MAG: VOC family protein [Mesorhizobium sp.]RWC00962.1 MAG: VOC family protein [Mesorhizobium sp.]RWG81224.1 MAG: VOC family protein [Mesorhizobium sp.]RWG88744.1 MAG: VOC family protein [Mesorhizobium sp.]RWK09078.1 MAG: VOC family protein [Mesorhizobium sp.]
MPKLGTVTPILRMFDIAKAREFYLDFLGFAVGFEHRFNDNAPLYMGLVRDGCELHLSEHHGDGSPGANVRIEVTDIIGLHRDLIGKEYRFNRPGLETTPWETREVTVIDPFGNRLTFYEKIAE